MAFFNKPKYSTVTIKKKDIPKDLFTRCPISGDLVYNKELESNFMVVPKSNYHFPLSAPRRIELLSDKDSFKELDKDVTSGDPLNFKGIVSYKEKLIGDKKKTNLNEAVITGVCKMGEIAVSLAVMDFRFRGGSMGSAVGEKITRAIEHATANQMPVIIVTATGGARMEEGILSLMQMAKTSAALSRLHDAGQLFISVLTNPTTGGVTASFATLGDIILAEPAALIGLAGPRVIKETIKEELPKGFQTAEFLLERGLLDQIVHRNKMRERIITFLHAFHLAKQPITG